MSRTVRIAALIWAGSMLLSRLVGLVREAVIGRTLGGGAEADVFWAAFMLPDFLNYALASGALSIVFIPIFQAHLTRGDEAAGWRAFSTIATFVTGLSVLGTVALWLLAPALAPRLAPGFDPAQVEVLVRLTRVVLPAQVFIVVGGVISATLQARDHHAMPALAPVVYSLGIVLGGLLLGPSLGAEGFAWGVLVGAAVGPFGLPLFDALRRGLVWRPRLDLRDPDFRTYLTRTIPVMLGVSVVALDESVVKYFGTEVGTGAVSRLQYARTLMKVPMGVFGFAAGLAAFPTLSRLFAEGKRAEARDTLVGALRMLLVLVVMAQVGLSVAGAEVAEVIWGTRRFSPEALAEIGLLTAVLSLSLWAWSAQSLLARGFYAQGNTWTPTLIGSAVLLAALPLYAALVDHGAVGLAVASSVSIAVYVAVLGGALWRGLPGGAGGLPGVAARLFVAGAAAYGLGVLLRSGISGWPALPRGALAGGVAVVVYVVLAHLLGVQEVRALLSRVRARIRR